MRLPADWKLGLIGLLCIACLGVGWSARRAAQRADAADTHVATLRDTIAEQKGITRAWKAAYGKAAARAEAASDGVTVTRTVWRTRSDTVIVDPRTAADTARAIAQIKGLKAAGDALADSATKLQVALTELRQTSDSTQAEQEHVIALQDRLGGLLMQQLARAKAGPRFSVVGQAGVEPLTKVPIIASQATLRLAGDWSVVTRGEYRMRPGESPRLDVLASHPLFLF